MSADQTSSRPEGAGSGNPVDIGRESPIIRAIDNSVKALETHRGYMERDLNETRNDMRDVKDRLSKLEVRVSDLPTKEWISDAVSKAVQRTATIVGMFAALVGIIATMIHLWR